MEKTRGFGAAVMNFARSSADFPGLLKMPKEKLEFDRLPDDVLQKISIIEDITNKMRMFRP